MTTPITTSTTDSQMHNNIMAAGSKDRPQMMATGRYAQWRSRLLRYIDTRPNGDALRKCILKDPYTPTIVTTQLDEIYSTVVACQTAQEMWEAIKRLQQEDIGSSISSTLRNSYKPTNNNLRTSSNTRNKNVDTTPRYKNDNQVGQFGNQRTVNVVGARETVGGPVVQQSGIQSEQSDWLADTDEEIDEQELEAHYSYMAKDSGGYQKDVECDNERVPHLANLIANLKLEVDENKNYRTLGNLIVFEIVVSRNFKLNRLSFRGFKAFNDHIIVIGQNVVCHWQTHYRQYLLYMFQWLASVPESALGTILNSLPCNSNVASTLVIRSLHPVTASAIILLCLKVEHLSQLVSTNNHLFLVNTRIFNITPFLAFSPDSCIP
ncbi:hypothetical protein Tco_1428279 [Tanacetum coccineum]